MSVLQPTVVLITLAVAASAAVSGPSDAWASHPPMRPLPVASARPLPDGPSFFVDALRGSDEADGSEASPWRSVNHALRQLSPGDTVSLRGGVYYEHVVVAVSGEEDAPITIRSYPGELAIIDGGLPEFLESPQTAWTPFPEGAEYEYVSTGTYPQFSTRPIITAFPADGWEPFYGKEAQRPVVLGHGIGGRCRYRCWSCGRRS